MRHAALTALLCALGCTPQRAPEATRPAAPTEVPVASASAAAEPTESAAPLSASSAEPESAPIVEPSSIGDVTCESDADCTITTRADCCECCASQPMATSRGWLGWRDSELCASTRCEPCGKVKCRYFEPEGSFRAVCRSKRCVLERAR